MINATSDVLNEITANSKDYAEALRSMLMRTDETMRTFTEVLVKSGTEAAARTEQLSEALPAIEARVQTLAHATERILDVEDLRCPANRGRNRRPSPDVRHSSAARPRHIGRVSCSA